MLSIDVDGKTERIDVLMFKFMKREGRRTVVECVLLNVYRYKLDFGIDIDG